MKTDFSIYCDCCLFPYMALNGFPNLRLSCHLYPKLVQFAILKKKRQKKPVTNSNDEAENDEVLLQRITPNVSVWSVCTRHEIQFNFNTTVRLNYKEVTEGLTDLQKATAYVAEQGSNDYCITQVTQQTTYQKGKSQCLQGKYLCSATCCFVLWSCEHTKDPMGDSITTGLFNK